jgi:hypothetical protein
MTYRLMCDGVDVDVDGHVLHLASFKLDDAQIDAAVESFRAMLKAEAEKPAPEPPPDYAGLYEKVTVELAVVKAEQVSAAADLKKYEASMDAIMTIDPKATKEDILKALEAATALSADVKPAPIEAEPIEKVG